MVEIGKYMSSVEENEKIKFTLIFKSSAIETCI